MKSRSFELPFVKKFAPSSLRASCPHIGAATMEVRRSSRASKRVLVEEEPEIDDEEEVVASAR
jgi:hypothetical protein